MKGCRKQHRQQQGIWHKRLRSTCREEEEEERLPQHPQQQEIWHKRLRSRSTCREEEEEERLPKRCRKQHPQQPGIWHKRLRSTCREEEEEERLPQHPQQQEIWHKRLRSRSTCREEEEERLPKRCRKQHPQQPGIWHKKLRSTCREEEEEERLPTDQFERLPDELVTAILMAHASSASCPADLHTPMLVCKRFYNAASHPMVLAQASKGALSVKASKWCDAIHGFLKRCADSGNSEACYILGMISFYCLRDRAGGARLMEKAANAAAAHVEALYSLAVIKLNGSGRSTPNVDDKEVRAGVALCMQAVAQHHIPAIRLLGQCFEDGYGVPANAGESERLFLYANAREANAGESGRLFLYANAHEAMLAGPPLPLPLPPSNSNSKCSSAKAKRRRKLELELELEETAPAIAAEMAMPIPETHPVHEFLVEWFEEHPLYEDDEQLRMCHYSKCGRPETRPSEFRLFNDMPLGTAAYCSRACHTLYWRGIFRSGLFRFMRWG